MQRSSRSSRLTAELSNNTITDEDQQELPTYDPASHVAKRERSRLRSAENAIHAIPLVLALCAIVLWFFSNSLVKDLRISHMLNGILFMGKVGAEFELKDSNPTLFTSHQAKRPPHCLSRSIITELF
ncbi:hypothetical protein SADUNF_Sadunf03G0055300 [Salix dunnii]|uniref:Uncharacterized protein n=1 Tax=Salix dunnii TaxID=1413687 RepID=A0A835N1S7_9ROSI|nr:hypothetical protein SADUNF_Sadunf03G0055300 [Salix dunnii]